MIKLIKSTFYRESETKRELSKFIMNTPKLSMGEQCLKFEKNFSDFQERKFACFVNSGSSANILLLQSLLNLKRIKRGDRIAFSSLTWSTNVMPIIQLGLIPVPIDVSLENLNVSSKTLKLAFNKTPFDVLFITNLLGFCANLDKISSFCKQKEIILLEDNCESLGSELNSKKLGNFGFASTFSFYVGHHLSTIEGGAVLTDDEELGKMLKIVRAHGWSRNISEIDRDRLTKKFSIDPFYESYSFFELGFNFRPSEINGFIGNLQLLYLNEMVKKRESNFRFFFSKSKENKHLVQLSVDHLNKISNFAFPLVFKSRDHCFEYRDLFLKNEIEIRPIVAGNITKQPFFKKYSKKEYKMDNAEIIHENGFYIPNNPELTTNEIKKLGELISK
tara:strand:- start:5234 stop:6403 length:1170 start_codon:yes stop_codon:yes gene_type:complete